MTKIFQELWQDQPQFPKNWEGSHIYSVTKLEHWPRTSWSLRNFIWERFPTTMTLLTKLWRIWEIITPIQNYKADLENTLEGMPWFELPKQSKLCLCAIMSLQFMKAGKISTLQVGQNLKSHFSPTRNQHMFYPNCLL